MHNERIINEAAKQNEQWSSKSSPDVASKMETSLESHRDVFLNPSDTTCNLVDQSSSKVPAGLAIQKQSLQEVKGLEKDSDCSIHSATLTKEDMVSELSMLEELLKASSISPTRLMSRNFPITSTHGSSLGSLGSDLSSTNLSDDQSSNNGDNFQTKATLIMDDYCVPVKKSESEQQSEGDEQNVESKADIAPAAPNDHALDTATQMNNVQTLGTLPIDDGNSDYKCKHLSNKSVPTRRKIQFLTKLRQRRCHLNVKK
jgi:hypothetical protein